jgi:hypothetical protein
MSTLRTLRRRLGAIVVATTAVGVVALTLPSSAGAMSLPGSAGPSSTPAAVGTPRLTLGELTAWQARIATPAGRAEVIADLGHAFSGVATVRTGAIQAHHQIGRPVAELASGLEWDHFWVIASYADAVNGALWAAVRACQLRLPSWLCVNAGNLLSSWASGWAPVSNHGVWAAIYWLPPHITGGRW